MLASLSPSDLSAFMSGGGSAADLSQVYITPTKVDRDAFYFVLQLIRQTTTRPHIKTFDFPLLGTAAGKECSKLGAGDKEREGVLALNPPDFHTWLCEKAKERGAPMPEKPALLLATGDVSAMASFIGGGGGSQATASTAASGMLDLFS